MFYCTFSFGTDWAHNDFTYLFLNNCFFWYILWSSFDTTMQYKTQADIQTWCLSGETSCVICMQQENCLFFCFPGNKRTIITTGWKLRKICKYEELVNMHLSTSLLYHAKRAMKEHETAAVIVETVTFPKILSSPHHWGVKPLQIRA